MTMLDMDPLVGVGYAYMQLASTQATQTALGLDGVDFMGRTLKVRSLYP